MYQVLIKAMVLLSETEMEPMLMVNINTTMAFKMDLIMKLIWMVVKCIFC